MPLVPTFAPATEDAGVSDGAIVVTVDDKSDVFPLTPVFAPETDDTAGKDEVNVSIGGDEEIDGLLVGPESNDTTGNHEVNAVTIKSSGSSSSPVCFALYS